jgi:hypothetical protein
MAVNTVLLVPPHHETIGPASSLSLDQNITVLPSLPQEATPPPQARMRHQARYAILRKRAGST